MHSELHERHIHLIEANVAYLSQALEMLRTLTDQRYVQLCPALPGQRVSSHLRHVIEFYESFLNGLNEYRVDYDARQRDRPLESNREIAIQRIRDLIDRLSYDPRLHGDWVIWVRAEGATQANLRDGFLVSSVGRELQCLASHTVHHFALIGYLLKLMGEEAPEDFGIAPSTLAYRASLRKADAA
jgi:hypothetical protein